MFKKKKRSGAQVRRKPVVTAEPIEQLVEWCAGQRLVQRNQKEAQRRAAQIEQCDNKHKHIRIEHFGFVPIWRDCDLVQNGEKKKSESRRTLNLFEEQRRATSTAFSSFVESPTFFFFFKFASLVVGRLVFGLGLTISETTAVFLSQV